MDHIHKRVKKEVNKIALISSPLLAAFGMSPIFMEETINIPQLLVAFSFLTIGIFIFWILNIYLKKRVETKTNRLLLSFGIILSLQFWSLLGIFNVPGENAWFKVYPLISSMAINGVIVLILDSIYLAHQNRINEMELRDIKVSKLESEKQLLIRQLQPHFLFNALTTLKALIEKSPAQATDYIIKLSEFLRYSVRPKQDGQLVTLLNELSFTQDYVKLQKVRFGESLLFVVDLPVEILRKQVLSFALQSLVENAIKHNKATKDRPLKIEVSESYGFLIVRNNLMKRLVVTGASSGLANLNERYVLESGKGIDIKENETHFQVKIPLL